MELNAAKQEIVSASFNIGLVSSPCPRLPSRSVLHSSLNPCARG
jgi:hypothetical protein